jgi:hypothetical protein
MHCTLMNSVRQVKDSMYVEQFSMPAGKSTLLNPGGVSKLYGAVGHCFIDALKYG